MKFSEIWYVDASQQTKKCYKKTFLDFGLFWPFLTKKQLKLTKNEENWQNPNRLMKFSEILVCRCFPTNKKLQKNSFWISAFFGRFLTKKQPKLTKMKKIVKIQTVLWIFLEIWYVDASQQKNATKNFFLDFGLFCRFLTKKQPKLTKNEESLQNLNRLMKFSEIWYVYASQQNKMLQKNFFWISAFFGRILPKNSQNWPKMKKIG